MKKLFSILCLLAVCLCSLSLFACSGDKTSSDIISLKNNILENYGNNGYISITFNENVNTLDMNDIFPDVLDKYLTYSSGMFFDNAKFQGDNFGNILNKFSAKERNELYKNLQAVKDNLDSLKNTKTIYEESFGNLKYQELINKYYTVIDSCYSLSENFYNAYSNAFNLDLSNVNNVNHNAVSVAVWQEVARTSKVSYNYNVRCYTPTLPYGSCDAWYVSNNARPCKLFVETTDNVVMKLTSHHDLDELVEITSKTDFATVFGNLQNNSGAFLNEYNNFITAINGVNLNEYFLAVNKTNYVNSLSAIEKSRFNVINRFFAEYYDTEMVALSRINTFLV